MIYIDPPYNTGNDFVYEDDFKDPLARYLEVISQATKSNPETMGRFHTAWLNLMYPRLRLAANLLRDDRVIFISIDDHEQANMKKLCDEVFGEENHLGTFIWKRRQMVDSRTKTGVSEDHEYALCYSKSGGRIRGKETDMSKYSNPDNDPNGDWMSADMTGLATAAQRPNLHYDLTNPVTGLTYPCPPTGWRYEKSRMKELMKNGEVIFLKEVTGRPRRKKYAKDLTGDFAGFSTVLNTVYNTQATRDLRGMFDESEYFDFPKPVDLLKIFIQQGTSIDNNDIILDFFSGSATIAHAGMQLNKEDGGNRKFICIQLPEIADEKSEAYKAGYKNICEIGKERIRRAGAKLLETDEQIKLGEDLPPLDTGFKVFKLDSSNIKFWDGIPVGVGNGQLYFDKIRNVIDGIKDDRPPLDVVYELMLKLGVPLTCEIEEKDILGKTVYSVDSDLLLFCLDKNITAEFVEALADLAPAKIIVAEMGFADDTAMANAHYILRDKGIEIKLV